MTPGDVALIPLPQVAGSPRKLRPTLVLAASPGSYQTLLVCGISTQLYQQQPDWDELIKPADADIGPSGLHRPSTIRLSYLHAADPREIAGVIGRVDPTRLERLLRRLAEHLLP
jgi:mRNA-degrading endonuclease toxin of MazEF toxin-antitoxin module